MVVRESPVRSWTAPQRSSFIGRDGTSGCWLGLRSSVDDFDGAPAFDFMAVPRVRSATTCEPFRAFKFTGAVAQYRRGRRKYTPDKFTYSRVLSIGCR
jgi:hypothetical protein